MKKTVFFFVLCSFTWKVSGQPIQGFQKEYKLLHSGNITADKNFYLITVLEQSPGARVLLEKNSRLKTLLDGKLESIRNALMDSCGSAECFLSRFEWTTKDSVNLDQAMRETYQVNKSPLDQIINRDLRPSGYYQKFSSLGNLQFLLAAWGQYVTGINIIIDEYGLGKKKRYPKIDSASYDVHGMYYQSMIRLMLNEVSEQVLTFKVFYQPSLTIALQLLDLNDRNEAARLEPLEFKENKFALEQVNKINWSKFQYATILILGSGPDVLSLPLSPIAKIRCRLGAWRFRQGQAPFIIVSGGYVHPFHTPFCEAIEMKKYLIQELGIPGNRIFIDPQARHTTTNIRNANRLLYRYRIPTTMPSLIVSTESHIDWILDKLPNQNFDNRCMIELGYLPYSAKKRVTLNSVSYFPTLWSLHMDPYDPLDP